MDPKKPGSTGSIKTEKNFDANFRPWKQRFILFSHTKR